jgi:hypothetical protein
MHAVAVDETRGLLQLGRGIAVTSNCRLVATLVAPLATLVTTRASLLALFSAPLALMAAVTLIRLNLADTQWMEALHTRSPGRCHELILVNQQLSERLNILVLQMMHTHCPSRQC